MNSSIVQQQGKKGTIFQRLKNNEGSVLRRDAGHVAALHLGSDREPTNEHHPQKRKEKTYFLAHGSCLRIQTMGTQTDLLSADFRPLLWRLKGS